MTKPPEAGKTKRREWWIDGIEESGKGRVYDHKCSHTDPAGFERIVHVIEYAAMSEAITVMDSLVAALQTANTYLRDIAELDRKNVTGPKGLASIHEIYEFAKEVAGNGFIDSSKALTEYRLWKDGQ